MKISLGGKQYQYNDEAERWSGGDPAICVLLDRVVEDAELFSVMPDREVVVWKAVVKRFPEAKLIEGPIKDKAPKTKPEGEVVY